jgi:hypothetical protein
VTDADVRDILAVQRSAVGSFAIRWPGSAWSDTQWAERQQRTRIAVGALVGRNSNCIMKNQLLRNTNRHIIYNNIKPPYLFFPSDASEWLKVHILAEHLTVCNDIRPYKVAFTKWTHNRVLLRVHQSNSGRVQPCLRTETLGLDPEILRLEVLGNLTALVNPYPANVDNMASSYQC